MEQLKMVFPVSMNQTPKQIRHSDLLIKLNRFNKNQRYQKEPEITMGQYCDKFKIDYDKEINKPVDQLSIYRRFSKRTYNK